MNATMDDKRQKNPRRLQAGCSTSKTSIENTGYHKPNRVLDADKNHSGLGELNVEKLPTPPGPVFYDGPHSKGNNNNYRYHSSSSNFATENVRGQMFTMVMIITC